MHAAISARPRAAGGAWADDFSAYPVAAGLPAGWTNRYTAPAYSIESNAAAIGGRWLYINGYSAGNVLKAWSMDAAGALVNADVLAAVRVTAEGFYSVGVIARGGGGIGTQTGYAAALGASDTVLLSRLEPGKDPQTIASTAFAHAASSTVYLRLNVDGTSLKVRAWPATAAEPASWLIEASDVMYAAAGWVGGVQRYNWGQPRMDYFAVNTAGAAPLP